jgi:hypothetical protein
VWLHKSSALLEWSRSQGDDIRDEKLGSLKYESVKSPYGS